MRYLTDHEQNDANKQINLKVEDEPGHGGANREYRAYVESHPEDGGIVVERGLMTLSFQNGPIREVGVNGVTHEVLLAVLIDRMRGFQSGDYACRENGLALDALEKALHWLQQRTNSRVDRGVEGTHEV